MVLFVLTPFDNSGEKQTKTGFCKTTLCHMSTEDGIFRLCYSFLQIKEDLTSIRHFAANGLVVALTSTGEVINFHFSAPVPQTGRVVAQDDLEALTLAKLIERMQSYLEQEISDSRKLMGYGMLWLVADVYGLEVIWEAMLHTDAEMFEVKGKADIMSFKRRLLGHNKTVNYRVDAIHQIDLQNRVVVADFECLIRGNEGRGTDIPKFDEDWKLIRVEALRHGLPLQLKQIHPLACTNVSCG